MRTTITLNDDLMSKLKEKAYKTGKPLKDVVNTTLYAGLKSLEKKEVNFSCPEFSLGVQPGFDIDRALDIIETLEDEEIVRKIQLKK